LGASCVSTESSLVRAPDLVLYVESDQGGDEFSFNLKVQNTQLCKGNNARGKTCPSKNPHEFLESISTRIERKSRNSATLSKIKKLGARMFREFIPLELQQLLWEVDRTAESLNMNPTLQIVSDVLYIPWEAFTISPSKDRERLGSFFGERFNLTRWPDNCGETDNLSLRRIAFISDDEKLGRAASERKYLQGIPDLKITKLANSRSDILQSMKTEGYDSWHFSTHGHTECLQLPSGESFDSIDLEDIRFKRCPLIFINACHSASVVSSLTGLDGLIPAFVKAQAGALIGCQWRVSESCAATYATAFYRSFLGGTPLGEAARVARREVRRAFPEDSSWLAYAAFGHPGAFNSRGQAPEDPAQITNTTPVSQTDSYEIPEPRPPKGSPKIIQSTPPIPGTELLHTKSDSFFVYVPGGKYRLGDNSLGKANHREHLVILSPFWLSKYPVTNTQYGKFLTSNPSYPPPGFWGNSGFSDPEQPVVGVSQDDANKYCQWADLQLPSEAQWEAAARGIDGRRYPWEGPYLTKLHAHFSDNSDHPSTVDAHPAGIGPFGNLGMAGNVWEWCCDLWLPNAYCDRNQTRDPVLKVLPRGSTPSELAVVRGGSWESFPPELRGAYRERRGRSRKLATQGFRCVWMPAPPSTEDP